MRQGLARDQKRPARVRSEDRVPLGNRNLVELYRFVIRSVVHQDVDATQFHYRFFDHGAHTLLDSDVALQGKSATTRSRKIDDGVLCLSRRTVKCNGNVGAGCRQRQRRSSPQPLRSSRDQHSFAEKRFVLCGLHAHDCIVLRFCPRSKTNSSISSEFLRGFCPSSVVKSFLAPSCRFVQPSCTLIKVIDSVATIPLLKHDPVFTSTSQNSYTTLTIS